jgi:hypothetical protein
MSKTTQNPQIIEFCENLSKLDAGEKARLKRNAGRGLAQSRRVMGLFFNKLLPHGVPRYQEEKYFLVATLYPLAVVQVALAHLCAGPGNTTVSTVASRSCWMPTTHTCLSACARPCAFSIANASPSTGPCSCVTCWPGTVKNAGCRNSGRAIILSARKMSRTIRKLVSRTILTRRQKPC